MNWESNIRLLLMLAIFVMVMTCCDAFRASNRSPQTVQTDTIISDTAVSQPTRVIAYPGLIQFELPNGKYISIFLRGDERIKWAETQDGYSILPDEEGYWVYAIINEDGEMVPSDLRASDESDRLPDEWAFLKTIDKGLQYSDRQIEIMLGSFPNE